MKPPRSFVLGPLVAPLFLLARQDRIFEVLAFVFMFATIFLLLLESVRRSLKLGHYQTGRFPTFPLPRLGESKPLC